MALRGSQWDGENVAIPGKLCNAAMIEMVDSLTMLGFVPRSKILTLFAVPERWGKKFKAACELNDNIIELENLFDSEDDLPVENKDLVDFRIVDNLWDIVYRARSEDKTGVPDFIFLIGGDWRYAEPLQELRRLGLKIVLIYRRKGIARSVLRSVHVCCCVNKVCVPGGKIIWGKPNMQTEDETGHPPGGGFPPFGGGGSKGGGGSRKGGGGSRNGGGGSRKGRGGGSRKGRGSSRGTPQHWKVKNVRTSVDNVAVKDSVLIVDTKNDSAKGAANFTSMSDTGIVSFGLETAAGTSSGVKKQEPWPFTLVQGPPGTGKTHTVWGTLNVIHLVQFQQYYTSLLKKLAPESYEQANESGSDSVLSGSIEEVLQNMDQNLFRTLPKLCAKPMMLVGAPLNAATDELLSRVLDRGFIDGEIRVYRPDVARVGAARCVLVGDPQQLPATVISKAAGTLLYSRTLFERFQLAGCPTLLLTVQYRMHPQIRDFPSSYFYQGRLTYSESISSAPDEIYYKDPVLRPYVFFNISHGRESHGGGSVSYENVDEARFCVGVYMHLQKALKSLNAGKVSVGVITPYKLQLKCLKHEFGNALGQDELKELYVNTVDAFQGQEHDVIIMSCVRASGHGVGFVSDIRRMNVALTSARRALWVMGNASALMKSEDWAALITDAKARNCFMEMDSLPQDLLNYWQSSQFSNKNLVQLRQDL